MAGGPRRSQASADRLTCIVIARSTNAEVAGLAFSPDAALLAWSQPWRPENGAAQIRLARLADGIVTDVTPPRFDDSSPAFTLDGKCLAFLSNRAFDPVYDAHHFDLGFLPGVRPYLVPLLATTPSPCMTEHFGHAAGLGIRAICCSRAVRAGGGS